MTKMESVKRVTRAPTFWALLALVTVFVYFFGLTIPLLGPDESRYSQVAREMFENGNWVTPTLGGFNWFEKPALLYWLQIASYHLFGVNEFAARFGSALFGLGTVASLWILGHLAIRRKVDQTESFANWLALIAATTIGLIVFARGASFDIILTFPITASLAGFFVFEHGDASRSNLRTAGLIAFYFFTGVSILAKGLVGVVFPFAIVGLYFVISWRFPDRSFVMSLIWGPIILLLVAASWNVPMYLEHGWPFIDEFYIQHHFQRYTSNKYQHPQPFHFFFWVLPLMTIPWIPFFFAAMRQSASWIWRARSDRESVGEFAPLRRFAAAWIVVPLAFFTFSGSKLPGYILPAVPGAIILIGIVVWSFIQRSEIRRLLVLGTACSTFAVIVVLLIFVVPRYSDADSVKRLMVSANEHGYNKNKVVGFKTISHNAEFYAAGRLIRIADGKQKRFESLAEIAAETRALGEPLLVLVPVEHLKPVTDSPDLQTTLLADNTDLAIVAVNSN